MITHVIENPTKSNENPHRFIKFPFCIINFLKILLDTKNGHPCQSKARVYLEYYTSTEHSIIEYYKQ